MASVGHDCVVAAEADLFLNSAKIQHQVQVACADPENSTGGYQPISLIQACGTSCMHRFRKLPSWGPETCCFTECLTDLA